MQIVVSPAYEHLRSWIEAIPQSFDTMGEVIYDARNQIRIIIAPDGTQVNVKRYHRPAFANRVIYVYFRKPKAKRAYLNAFSLLDRGIATPTPIGYILCGNHLLAESFLITLQSPLKRNFYEFRHHPLAGYEDIIRQFARFTAEMHKKDILHLDYSPGNILFDVLPNGAVSFALVDINRMRIGHTISQKEACKSFRRLWGEQDFFELLGKEYATARGWDEQQTSEQIIHYWKQFWRNRK